MCPKCSSLDFVKNGKRNVTVFNLKGSRLKVINRYICKECSHTWSTRVQFYADEIYKEIVNLLIKKTNLIERFLKNLVTGYVVIYPIVQ